MRGQLLVELDFLRRRSGLLCLRLRKFAPICLLIAYLESELRITKAARESGYDVG